MTTIISKSGTGVPSPDKLETAELAVDVSTGDLYTKLSDNSVVQINGGSTDGGTGAGMVISETEPADPVDGMQWLNTTAVKLYFYDDGKWLEVPYSQNAGSGDGGDSKPEGYEETKAIASGAMTTGEMIVLNDDNTVSVVSESFVPGGNVDSSIGNAVLFASGSTDLTDTASAYDPVNKKIVIVYKKDNAATASVGTVSGDSITFGSPVVFSGRVTNMDCAYDSSASKVVVVYRDADNANKGTAVVGEVSGDTIVFGTPEVYCHDNTQNNHVMYEPVEQKPIVFYKDNGSSAYGYAHILTVSGNSITVGARTMFSDSSVAGYVSSTYDPVSKQIVVAYEDGTNQKGKVALGTLSSGTISFGSPVEFSGGRIGQVEVEYDHEASKIFIAYRDMGNSSFGTAIAGSISGSSVTFGTPVVFHSASTSQFALTYHAEAGKPVIFYRVFSPNNDVVAVSATLSGNSITFDTPDSFSTDGNNIAATYDADAKKAVGSFNFSSTGLSGTYNPGYISADSTETNLTDSNFLGVSTGDYADGAEATVQIAGINNDQQGMTLGKQYIQPDGSLDTTAGDPAVEAGTAISSTELNIKDTV